MPSGGGAIRRWVLSNRGIRMRQFYRVESLESTEPQGGELVSQPDGFDPFSPSLYLYRAAADESILLGAARFPRGLIC